MKFYCTNTYEEMSKKAANLISAQIILKPESILGLATGSSPIGTYQNLIKGYQNGDLDFSKIQTVNLDEYLGLSHESDQSYFYFMNTNLFKHVNISLESTHLPNGLAKDVDAECKQYDQLICELGGVDLQLLGLGHNGHIGFNEPAADFPKGTHCVDLTESTINANSRLFANPDEVPRKALTMGIQTIMNAKKIVMVVSGEDKADIVKEAFFGPITPNVPASILQLHPDVTIIGDEAAFSNITL